MALGTAIGLGPGDIVLDGDAAAPTDTGTTAPRTFLPMSIVANRSPISATAKFLLWPPCVADADIIFLPCGFFFFFLSFLFLA